jgi:hypothetical protein
LNYPVNSQFVVVVSHFHFRTHGDFLWVAMKALLENFIVLSLVPYPPTLKISTCQPFAYRIRLLLPGQ